MVNILKAFNDELVDFLKLNIQFNRKYNKYVFKGNWTSEINEAYFDKRIEKLKTLLYDQLRVGKRNDLFLNQTLSLIRARFDFFHEYDYSDFSFLKESRTIIPKNHTSLDHPPKEKFNYDFFLNNPTDNYLESEEYANLDQENTSKYLHLVEVFHNNDATEIKFEEHKLMYCIIMFQEKVFELQNFIENLQEDHEMIDFGKTDFNKEVVNSNQLNNETILLSINNLEEKIGNNNKKLEKLMQNKKVTNQEASKKVKCKINLNKISVAEFVAFLIKDGTVFLDENNTKNNKVQMQNFFQDHFTYQALNKAQADITKLNREIADTHFEDKKKYNAYIDKLISILQSKKMVVK